METQVFTRLIFFVLIFLGFSPKIFVQNNLVPLASDYNSIKPPFSLSIKPGNIYFHKLYYKSNKGQQEIITGYIGLISE